MPSSCQTFVSSLYDLHPGRVALSVAYGPGLTAIYPFVFEGQCKTAMGIIAMCVVDDGARETVHLYHISAFKPNLGHGTQMLKALCDAADHHQVPISLAPVPSPNGTSEILDEEQLVAWYGRHGFSGSGQLMREPTKT